MDEITDQVHQNRLSASLSDATPDFNERFKQLFDDLFQSGIYGYYCTNDVVTHPKETFRYSLKINRRKIDYKDHSPTDSCHFQYLLDQESYSLSSQSGTPYTIDTFISRLESIARDIDHQLATVYIRKKKDL